MGKKILPKVQVAVLYVILNPFIIITAQQATWNYKQQENWPGKCNVGSSQSPINIKKNTVIQQNNLPALNFQNFDKAVPTNVMNNGHSALVTIPGNVKPSLSGGGLNGTYNFENLHFHWPAEHTIDGQGFNLEAHMVFYSSKYPNIEEATKNKDGIAVLGIFYNRFILLRGPPIFDALATAAQNVSKVVNTQTVTGPVVFQELIPNIQTGFYFYRGSLTTPDCNEVVLWFLLSEIGRIGSHQYKLLTTIYGADNQVLTFTNRKIQPLNGRPVYYKL